MDAFETDEKENNEENNGEDEILVKPIDDKSIISNNVYYKLNIDYLINNNYINTKIEDFIDHNNDNKVEDEKVYINEIKETDYYYDINKFYSLYLNIKRFEIEENTISQDILYQMFFKPFVLNVYNDLDALNKNIEKKDNEQQKENKEEKEEENEEEVNNNQKEEKKKKYLTGICEALKKINTKQIFKLFNLYQIPIEYHDQEQEIKNTENIDINKEENEIKENEENEKDKENKIIENAENNIENENRIEEEKENNEEQEDEDNKEKSIKNEIKKDEEKKIEYEIYINLKELFTVFSLIGCQILTVDEEEKINKELKDKIVKNGYLNKEDFMEYNFWFEKNFEYQNNINEENNEWVIEDYKDKKMNIKELIFEIWKDNSGKNINIKQFLMMLKIGNYITDLNSNNNKKYYDIIFN